MPGVDRVGDGLADLVVGDDRDLQVVSGQEGDAGRAVPVVAKAALDFEVIAPATEFDALVSPIADLAGQGVQRHVGERAGEQGDGSRASITFPNPMWVS